ncbi:MULTISPECIES: PTS sugar transporter subunit IIA [unclassified Luteococcus]|uniref:PTS sugar transporter subunit IIA n=1 Tax=unclassified Luteococcus TaxID=2639923 RepID=UPI00313C2225
MTRLLDLLDLRSMDLRLTATTKQEAITQMVELMARSGVVCDAPTYLEAVLARESEGTTGLGDDVAIPHAKSDGVLRPAVAFARAPQGIDWGASDGSLTRLVFLIGVPAAQAGDEHLRILAMLARKLVNGQFRTSLLEAADEQQVREILAVVGA